MRFLFEPNWSLVFTIGYIVVIDLTCLVLRGHPWNQRKFGTLAVALGAAVVVANTLSIGGTVSEEPRTHETAQMGDVLEHFELTSGRAYELEIRSVAPPADEVIDREFVRIAPLTEASGSVPVWIMQPDTTIRLEIPRHALSEVTSENVSPSIIFEFREQENPQWWQHERAIVQLDYSGCKWVINNLTALSCEREVERRHVIATDDTIDAIVKRYLKQATIYVPSDVELLQEEQ